MEEEIIIPDTQLFSTKYALLSEEDYRYWNAVIGKAMGLPVNGTVEYASSDPEKDANGLCVLPIMSYVQEMMQERKEELDAVLARDGKELPVLVETFEKVQTEIDLNI